MLMIIHALFFEEIWSFDWPKGLGVVLGTEPYRPSYLYCSDMLKTQRRETISKKLKMRTIDVILQQLHFVMAYFCDGFTLPGDDVALQWLTAVKLLKKLKKRKKKKKNE